MVIYESDNGKIKVGWLGGLKVWTPRIPFYRPPPAWLKARIGQLHGLFRQAGLDATKEGAARTVLFEYVLEQMGFADNGLAHAAAASEPVQSVFDDLLGQMDD